MCGYVWLCVVLDALVYRLYSKSDSLSLISHNKKHNN